MPSARRDIMCGVAIVSGLYIMNYENVGRYICQVGILHGIRPRDKVVYVLLVLWVCGTWLGSYNVESLCVLCIFLWKRCHEARTGLAASLLRGDCALIISEMGVLDSSFSGEFRKSENMLACLGCVLSVI